MSEKIYKFVGQGDGVPGLPHEVSEAEAKALGAADLLAEAIKSGAYIEKNSGAQRAASKTAKSIADEKE